MGDFCTPAVVKARESAIAKKEQALRSTYVEKVNQIYGTLQQSKLFCNFYYPDKYAKTEGDPYKRFGFFWPRHEDLVKLCMTHKIEPTDLVLERISWKKDGCGFSLLQLIFKGGICSPFFKTKDCDEENYKTTHIS